ncbi:MAG: hypothetical protein R3C58_10000 [Parvularculaceae bacterium]
MRHWRSLLALLTIFTVDSAAAAGETRVIDGWVKTYAAAPLDENTPFEAPDYHGSLIEASARGIVKERLLDLGFREVDAADDNALTISVSVKAPEPKGRKPLPKSPIQIASEDRNPFDNIYDPELRAEWVDVEKRRKGLNGADELTVTIYARRGDERIWSGYAGAALDGGSREDVANGLVQALLEHFGASAAIANAPISLAGSAPAITIIEPAAEEH